MKRRLYVDVTRTARETTYTGIQKVVRTTYRALAKHAAGRDCEVVAIAIDKHGAYRLDDLPRHAYEQGPSQSSAIAQKREDLLAQLRRFGSRQPDNFAKKAIRLGGRLVASLMWRAKRLRGAFEKRDYVIFQPGDILLLPDSAWVENPWPVVADLKARGGTLAAIWYDLIPVTHPHFFSEQLVASFRNYLEKIVTHADHVACISQTVQLELEAFAARMGAPLHVETVYPIITASQAPAKPRHDLGCAFARPTLLIVATIEPRKGHALLLEACEALWAEGLDFNLVIIGRVGWKVQSLLDRLSNHPENGRRLFLFHDASDADVAFAFQRARLLVFPSETEGLGLPILEAELAGCPTLCSDIPVFREIASPSTRFFSPYSAAGLKEALQTVLADGARPAPLISASTNADERASAYANRLFDVVLARRPSHQDR